MLQLLHIMEEWTSALEKGGDRLTQFMLTLKRPLIRCHIIYY